MFLLVAGSQQQAAERIAVMTSWHDSRIFLVTTEQELYTVLILYCCYDSLYAAEKFIAVCILRNDCVRIFASDVADLTCHIKTTG